MATQVHPTRGMRDFLPADKARREYALGVIREVYRAHGFDEIETPVVEDWARLHAGLGGDNEKLSFSILKRGITGEALAAAATAAQPELLADLGLRFDLTVPLTRFYASHRAELPPVFRSIQIAPVWRAERPQKGRYRQFVQADIDIIGESGLLAEVELITATSQALNTLGLQNCVIRVNDRRILLGVLAACGFDAAEYDRALIIVDKLDKIGVDGVANELAEIRPAAAAAMRAVLSTAAPKLDGAGIPLTRSAIEAVLPDSVDDAGIAALSELGSALSEGLPTGVTLVFDPTLVRGMGYYTGTIFEVSHPESGGSIGGGGRYDGMVGRFLGQDVPAVGFSIGFERIVDLITVPDTHGTNAIALICDDTVPISDIAALKRDVIAAGHRVRIEKRQKNMKVLLARVAAEGVPAFANVRSGMRSMSDLEIRRFDS